MKTLVVGGAGFIGSHLVDRLVTRGPVTVYDNLSVGKRAFLKEHLDTGRVTLVEAAEHVLPREPAPLGAALGDALVRDGIELVLGAHATAVSCDGDDYALTLLTSRRLRALDC